MEVYRAAVSLMVRSAVLSAQCAAQQRLLLLHQAATVGGDAGELARLKPRASSRARRQALRAERGVWRLAAAFTGGTLLTPWPTGQPAEASQG
jgi:hypothetical protein